MLKTKFAAGGHRACCWAQAAGLTPSLSPRKPLRRILAVHGPQRERHKSLQWPKRGPTCGAFKGKCRQRLAERTRAAGAGATQSQDEDGGEERPETLVESLAYAFERLRRLPVVKRALQTSQFAASLLFVVLYVWSTYSTPQPFSWRANLDLCLCAVFAVDYAARYLEAESKTRMVTGFWNILDLLAFLPPLLEACLFHGANVHLKLGRFDLRWFKILRALRVMRVSLLAGELKQMHLSSTGALLSGAASVRLFQLIASVLTLLFTTSSIVHLVERIPFHTALYFVTTTLTTVGYGDVVMQSTLGKAVVLAMICVGVVLIPVQTSQLYSQLTARRVTLGTVPDGILPTVLVSTRLTEVRGFSDFFSEFFQALKRSRLPQKLRLVVLCNRPNFEFRAFQELNDKRLTLMEGSALSERDLMRSRAESASACLLLADRFSPNPQEEDLNLQFQVWALKSYVPKRLPLYVQVLQKSSLQLISPFLDPEQDVLVSMEQTRHRLLALSCLCPGASTLIANLLRRAAVSPKEGQRRTAGGRRWLRAYLNGCAFKVFDATLSPSLARVPFAEAAEWLYRTSGFVLMGVLRDKQVILNPGRRRLQGGETAIVIGTTQQAVDNALAQAFTAAAPLQVPFAVENAAAAGPSAEGAHPPAQESPGIKASVARTAGRVLNGSTGPIDKAASWISTLTNAVGIKHMDQPLPQASQSIDEEEFFYPEDNMPCILDSPYCKYDRFGAPAPSAAADEAADDERRRSQSSASTSGSDDDQTAMKFVEGYSPIIASPWRQPEPSESFDEEDDPEALHGFRRTLRMTIEQFYTNLGDLTSPKSPAENSAGSRRRSTARLAGAASWHGTDASTEDAEELRGEHSRGSNGADGLPRGKNAAEYSDRLEVQAGDSDGSQGGRYLDPSASLSAADGGASEGDSQAGEGSGGSGNSDDYAASATADDALAGLRVEKEESVVRSGGEKGEDGSIQRAESMMDLPELTTESYDEDPEDDNVLSGKELAARAAEAADLDPNSDEEEAVPEQQATSSLERHREPAQDSPAYGSKSFRGKREDQRAAEELTSKVATGEGSAVSDDSDRWSFDTLEADYGIEDYGDVGDVRLAKTAEAHAAEEEDEDGEEEGLSNHIIMCGAEGSFASFVQQVRRCDPISTSIVVLHPHRPKAAWPALMELGPVHFIQGNPSDAASLQKACASQARALVFLANAHRPTKAEEVNEGDAEGSFASRTAVLADAQGLLTCYGVGEDGAANLPHAVVELTFTSSVRFLQPGLLLKGQGFMDELPTFKDTHMRNQPRKSWQMRKRQERAAIKEGLAEWQANPYYCAGRVTVPALMDTFACQCFFNQGMLTDLMEELAGDDGRAGGAQLRQLPLPEGMAGRTYGELFASMTLTRKLLPLGLYRRKSENPAWRLYYVVTNPPPEERLDIGDRVFVLRERGGPWLTALPP